VGPLGGQELVIIIIVLALIFGASRLPLLGRNVGQGIKEFKKGVREAKDDDKDKGKEPGRTDAGTDASANGVAPGDDVAAKRRD
jgi:sec-independent protein translocase protein TatA